MAEGRVLGIGGIFLRAQDPQRLAAWYRDNLGFTVTCAGQPSPDGAWFWQAEGGDTVFSIFPADSDYFAADRQVMINLRVSGMDALIARLRDHGIAVETRAEWDHPETGRFARIHDAEGNPIELWEPPA
ncbi:putative enzyme related to lactoylglutathione lyase [Altererythrobacter atlanticus]|uniref:Glyoxalase-like domain protein n=1 Tax=Croceibacterium atlanticum TaxID=1267766 RepID=A0A0F7KY03_9SPHN|nr:VOC family protein [Croceibacterium atlanticum]AKH44097.1 Glyoxalase-like domain protein [Croceibacterium atlanticum]MBB5732407.1 putative enzyme related to lactoylglutathione lyase [Croceibacterium atlanticum]